MTRTFPFKDRIFDSIVKLEYVGHRKTHVLAYFTQFAAPQDGFLLIFC